MGSASIILLLALVIFFSSGIGLWKMKRVRNQIAENQLKLDLCLQRTLIKMRNTLNALESSNARMKELRIAIVAAHLTPQLLPALETALKGVFLFQELKLIVWKKIQAEWVLKRGCTEAHGVTIPIKSIPIHRLPPDTIGPQPFSWKNGRVEFHVWLKKASKSSSGVVKYETKWKTRYARSIFN